MLIPSKFNILVFLALVILNLGCDQISKSKIRKTVNQGEVIEIIGSHFIVTNAENTGAFLGLGSELPKFLHIILLKIVPTAAILFMFMMAVTQLHSGILFMLGMGFALGGGIGNIYDRIILGSVTDFLFIDLGIFKTGIFNLADVSVMIGLIMLLIHFINIKHKPKLIEN